MYLANNKAELANYLRAHGFDGSEAVWQFDNGSYFIAAMEGDAPPPGTEKVRPIGALREVVERDEAGFLCPNCNQVRPGAACTVCGAENLPPL